MRSTTFDKACSGISDHIRKSTATRDKRIVEVYDFHIKGDMTYEEQQEINAIHKSLKRRRLNDLAEISVSSSSNNDDLKVRNAFFFILHIFPGLIKRTGFEKEVIVNLNSEIILVYVKVAFIPSGIHKKNIKCQRTYNFFRIFEAVSEKISIPHSMRSQLQLS
jgi:hypothetical protein